MKKLFFPFLVFLFICSFSNPLTAQPKAETYRLLHVKFKPGKAKEGMDIGKNYFSRAYAEAGHSTQIVEFNNSDGEWDGIVLIPLSAGLPEEGQPHPKAVMEKLVGIAGGDEALQKIQEHFNSMVEQITVDEVQLTRF
jgi:hypothetical protein